MAKAQKENVTEVTQAVEVQAVEVQEMEATQAEETTTEQVTLEAWDTLNEEQQALLKESLLKSKYGIGGEHFSTFPTLLDNKINTWVEEEYSVSKLPKRITEATFKAWEAKGTLQILPLLKGEKIHYLVVLLPNKNVKLQLWQLDKEAEKPYLKYTTHNPLGELQFTNQHFHILNSYTNKNKAYNQAKQLVKLLQLGTDFKELEQQKELRVDHLQLDIEDGKQVLKKLGKNGGKYTGKQYQSIGEYLGRKQHTKVAFDYLSHIN